MMLSTIVNRMCLFLDRKIDPKHLDTLADFGTRQVLTQQWTDEGLFTGRQYRETKVEAVPNGISLREKYGRDQWEISREIDRFYDPSGRLITRTVMLRAR